MSVYTEKENIIFSKVNIVTFFIMLLTAFIFVHFVLISTANENSSYFRILYNEIKDKVDKINNEKKNVLKINQPEKPKNFHIDDVPTFLSRLNQMIKGKVKLDMINKLSENSYTYEILFYSTFSKLIELTKLIESTNIAIQDLDIHPYSPPDYIVNMTLILIKNKMEEKEIQTFKKYLSQFTKERDPFRYKVYSKKGRSSDIKRLYDLTWNDNYHLTGIGGEKEKTATINHRTYVEGDTLDGMLITKILNDRVRLKKGKNDYLIKFRLK